MVSPQSLCAEIAGIVSLWVYFCCSVCLSVFVLSTYRHLLFPVFSINHYLLLLAFVQLTLRFLHKMLIPETKTNNNTAPPPHQTKPIISMLPWGISVTRQYVSACFTRWAAVIQLPFLLPSSSSMGEDGLHYQVYLNLSMQL